MSERWEKNGRSITRDRPQYHSSHNGQERQQQASQTSQLFSPETIKGSVEGFIKRTPAKSLLIAVTAGLAIGWLVKR